MHSLAWCKQLGMRLVDITCNRLPQTTASWHVPHIVCCRKISAHWLRVFAWRHVIRWGHPGGRTYLLGLKHTCLYVRKTNRSNYFIRKFPNTWTRCLWCMIHCLQYEYIIKSIGNVYLERGLFHEMNIRSWWSLKRRCKKRWFIHSNFEAPGQGEVMWEK